MMQEEVVCAYKQKESMFSAVSVSFLSTNIRKEENHLDTIKKTENFFPDLQQNTNATQNNIILYKNWNAMESSTLFG